MPAPAEEGRKDRVIALLGAIAPALVLAVGPLGNTDLWFHLATGRLIAASGRVPHVDTLSFTARGAPWVAHEWLWELAVWALWSAFGATAIIAFRVLEAVSALVGAWLAAQVMGSTSRQAGVATALLSFAAARRFSDRPQMFTLACFAVLLALIELHRQGRVRPLRWLVLPLVLVWSNAHAGVLYGLVLLGYELVWTAWERKWARMRELGMIFNGALAVCLALTPFGLRGLTYPFELLRLDQMLGVAELRPLWEFRHDSTLWPAAGALAAGTLAALVQLRRDPRGSLRALALIAAAVWHVRGLDLAAVASIPVAAGTLGALHIANEKRFFAMAVPLAMLISIEWLSGDPDRRPGLGVELAAVPQGAVAFLQGHRLQGNGYNSEPLGGYLLFADPERPVFIDGRNDPYGQLITALAHGLDPFTRWNLRYGVLTYTDAQLPTLRQRMPLVWFDDVAQIVSLDHPELGLPCLLPEGPFLAVSGAPTACESQAERVVAAAASSWRAAVIHAEALSRLGRGSDSDRELARAASLPKAPPRDSLGTMRDLGLALLAPPDRRASELEGVAKRSGEPADTALVALARGDCGAWRLVVSQRPALAAWDIGPDSPVTQMADAACRP